MLSIKNFMQNDAESTKQSLDAVEKINYLNCHDHIHILYMIIDYLHKYYPDKNLKYLEIGTFMGGSLLTCMQNKIKVDYTGIDWWKSTGGHAYSKEKVIENIKKHNIHNHNYKLIQGSSWDKTTYQQLEGLYDIILIDGNHAYQSVIKDFNIYKNYISKNGFIVFDDYVSMPDVKPAVEYIIKNLNPDEWIVHGNIENLLPNKCSKINFKYHKKIIDSHHNAYLDKGGYVMNNEFIIEKK